MGKKKYDSKAFAAQKRSRRRVLTFLRILRYGGDNFLRNSWLSVAATAVMVITLLIIFISASARIVLTDTIGELNNKIDMSIYLKTDTTDKVGEDLTARLLKLESVKSVKYISSAAAREQIAKENSNDASILAALSEATNMNPATLRVVVVDINDTSELESFVKQDELVKANISEDYKPSFAGDRRATIKSIARAVNFSQQVGIIVGSVFVIISSLIIYNTISMAIFNRREEIQMMKLIGADKSFIRGPFLVESVIYGIIAAFIAAGLGAWGLFSIADTLTSYQITVQPTLDLVRMYAPIGLVIMIGIGATIGFISSLFATRRYLRL